MSNFKEFSIDNFKFTTCLPFYSYLYSQNFFVSMYFWNSVMDFFVYSLVISHVTKIEIAFLFNIGGRGDINKVAF